MDLARSTDTDEIVKARETWEEQQNGNQDFTSKNNFKCLDEEHCGIQLTLAGYGNPNANRIYFRRSRNKGGDHTRDCVMKHGSDDEKDAFLKGIFEKLNQNVPNKEEVIRSSMAALKNIEIIENPKQSEKKKDIEDFFNKDTILTFKNKNQNKRGDSLSVHKGLRNQKLSALGSVYLQYKEQPDTVVNSIYWPEYDKNNKIMKANFVKQLVSKKPLVISDIMFDIDRNPDVPMNLENVYFFKSWVDYYENKEKATLKSVKNDNLVIFLTMEELKGMTNVELLRTAGEKGFPIEIAVVGHFYLKSNGRIQWHSRTSNVHDWIFIPDLDEKK
ncbi:hypothetical protein ACQ7C6_00100 [Lactiplantibacillus plantarum]|uniref:hypothetical protein n=1 Tax=Lactiplantibacillus plantarum TaxID=1590 RepID=UPI00226D744D|nr:hypothetical protein [Lactiplantibacillus plantarum]